MAINKVSSQYLIDAAPPMNFENWRENLIKLSKTEGKNKYMYIHTDTCR